MIAHYSFLGNTNKFAIHAIRNDLLMLLLDSFVRWGFRYLGSEINNYPEMFLMIIIIILKINANRRSRAIFAKLIELIQLFFNLRYLNIFLFHHASLAIKSHTSYRSDAERTMTLFDDPVEDT